MGKTKEECQQGYNILFELLLDLSFTLSIHNVVPPCQGLTFLGIYFDTVKLTLSLPVDKLSDLLDLINTYLHTINS